MKMPSVYNNVEKLFIEKMTQTMEKLADPNIDILDKLEISIQCERAFRDMTDIYDEFVKRQESENETV